MHIAKPFQNRRKHKRWAFHQSNIGVAVEHPAGGISRFLVMSQNLSRTGMAFVHAGYLHKNSECKFLLRKQDGSAVTIEGKVASCRHIDGMRHEIGIRFETEIDPAQFVFEAMQQTAAPDTTSLPLSAINGRILYVDDCDEDRNLMQFMLQASGADVSAVASATEAISLAEQMHCAAVVTELNLPAISGTEVARGLREMGYVGPIVGVTADDNPQLSADATSAGCTAVLIKPVDVSQIAEILARCALTKDAACTTAATSPLFSERWSNVSMRPLISEFVNHLESRFEQLERMVRTHEWESAEKLCLTLKGSAGGYGFPEIMHAAAAMRDLLKQKSDSALLVRQLGDLRNLNAAALLALQSKFESRAA